MRCKCGFVQDGEIYFSPMTKFMKERGTDVSEKSYYGLCSSVVD